MYNVTSLVKAMFDNNYRQVIRITCNPVTGDSFTLDENDIISGSLSIDRYSVTGDRIEIGTASAGELSFKIKNYDGEWSNTTFEGCEMYVRIGIADWYQMPTEAEINYIPCGYFKVDRPVKNAQILEITALDRMAKFDKYVDTSSLLATYNPRTLIDFCCTQCGVLLANGSELANFPNANYTVSIPENVGELTYRNLLQGACMLLGACAFIDWNGLLRIKWYGADAVIKTVTGNPIVITDGADNKYVSDCLVSIQPYQSGSGDPSPTNVRPISGWTEAEIKRCGKNLFDKSVNAKNFYVTSTPSLGNGGTCLIFSAPYGESVTISGTRGNRQTLYYVEKPISEVVAGTALTRLSSPSMPFTITSVHQTYVLYMNTSWDQSIVDSIQIELGSTATAYEPYTGTTYSVDMSSAGTVYGGTLDVMTGVLTVTSKGVDLGSYTWEAWAGYAGVFRTSLPADCKMVANNVVPNWLCSCYKVVQGTSVAGNDGTISQLHQAYLLLHDNRYSSAADLKTGITGQTLVYELITPVPYQLTPAEVTTLLGNNTLTCNCGNITLSYFADTDMRNLVDLGDEFWETDITESSGDEINVAYSPLSQSVTVNGTSSMEGRCNLVDITLNAGTYLLSGIPYGLQSLQFQVTGAEVNAFDSGGGALFTVPSSGTYRVYLFVPEGNYTYDNVEVAPSIIKMPDVYPYYTTSNRYNHTLQENDIEITGVYYAYEDEERVLHEYLNGTKNYCLDISDNPFVNRQTVESVVQALGTARVGFTYRPITMTVKPAPYLYPMDMFDFVTVNGELVHGIVSKITFGVNAHTHIESNGETKEDNGYATYGNFTSIQSKIIEKAKTQISRVVNERTTLLLNLNEMIANSLGLYVTAEPVTGGGYQYYFHDGTTLASSNIIYTFTANGLAWTDNWNGGEPVWQYGITRDGNAIVNMLSAYKVSADIISSGVIMSDTGNNYWNLRTGDFYNSIVTKESKNVQNYVINPLLTIGTGETVPYYWEIIGSDTAEVVNDAEMGMCWHFISTTAKCGARNNAGAIQVGKSASKVYAGANIKVMQSGHFSDLGYKVRAQLTVVYSDNTNNTIYSAAYVERLNNAEKVTFEFEVDSTKVINYLLVGFYNTYISTQETTQETYYADMWCSLVDVSDSESFTINATAADYTASTIDYVVDTEVGHVLMNDEKAEFVGTTIKGSEIVFAPTANSAVTAKESKLGSNGGVIFEGDGDFTVETATVGITGKGSSGGTREVQIVGYDGNGNSKNLIQMNDEGMVIRFTGNNHNITVRMSDAQGLRIEIDGVGYSNLGWVDDGNGHAVLGK